MGHGRNARRRGRGEALSNLLYLGIAVVLSIIGCLVLYLRNRRPTSLEAGIEEFQRELRALAPNEPPGDRRERRSGWLRLERTDD